MGLFGSRKPRYDDLTSDEKKALQQFAESQGMSLDKALRYSVLHTAVAYGKWPLNKNGSKKDKQ